LSGEVKDKTRDGEMMKFTKRVLGLSVAALCFSVGFSASVLAADDAAALLSKAKASYSSGDYRTAVIHLKNALQQSPQAAEARILLGRTYLKLLNGQGAEQEFKKALQQGATKGDVSPLLAQSYLMQGKAKQIIDEITVNKSDSPKKQAEILSLHGEAHLMNHAVTEAEESYKQALALDPQAEGGLLGAARVALLKNDSEQASKHVSKAMHWCSMVLSCCSRVKTTRHCRHLAKR
jgi:tetratricopeptide (TPR) repeat protein